MNTQIMTAQERQNERRRTNPECKRLRAEYYKEWYEKNGRGRSQKDRELYRLWAQQNPRAVRARQIVFQALKSGRLVKPGRCVNCNQRRVLLAHHENYDFPYMVTWLCYSCHPRKRN